jgi:DNA-binding transcriptional ArsR family regulator
MAIPFNEANIENASQIIRAIAHPLRLQILEFIDKNKGTNVNKIYTSLGLEQSITSQHLRTLRLAGVVETQRDGKQIYYTLQHKYIQVINQAIKEFLEPTPAAE